MKKYLFNGAMALIVGAFIVSCSHDDIGQTSTVEQMTKSFDEMFTELYGPIAPNHNWGFNTVVAEEGEDETTEEQTAGTRTTQKEKHRWGKEGGIFADLAEPTPLTDAERADVANYFAKTEFSDEGLSLNWTEYYVEWVSNVSETSAYRNEGDQRGDMGNVSITFDKVSVESTSQWADNGYEEISDWNASTHPTYYMYETVGTGKFRVWVSYASKWNTKFTVREYKGNYYVGFDIDVTKDSDGRIDLGKKTLGYYNDYIIRLIPGKGQTTPSTPDPGPVTPARESPYLETKTTTTTTYRKIVDLGRVFCEDIATAARGIKEDIDYNDIVFDARVWEYYDMTVNTENGRTTTFGPSNISYKYDISMLAAGGTIPENVGINNVDVHDAFGVGLTFMVNTWTEKSTAFGQYNTPTNVMQPKYNIISYTLSYNDLPDKNNIGIGSIPINVKYNGQNVMALDNRTGEAPYKLCVPIGTLWPIERVSIDAAYLDFGSFVNSNNTFYTGRIVNENLYTQAPTSSIQYDMNNGLTEGKIQAVNTYTSSSEVIVVWAGSISEKNSDITLYNYTFSGGEKLRFYGSGTIRVVNNKGQAVFENIHMPGGYCDITVSQNSQAASLNEGTIIIDGSNFSLTKIAVLQN